MTQAINKQNFRKVRLTGSVFSTNALLCTPAVWSTFAEIHSTHWNFRLELWLTHHKRDLPNLSYDCDLWIHLVFRLLLVPFWRVGLSVEAKDAWTFYHCFHRISFALLFLCTFMECVTYITKYMNSTGIIMNFERLRDIQPTASPFKSTSGSKVPLTSSGTSQFWNKSYVICSTVFDLHGRSSPDGVDDISAARQPINIRPEVDPSKYNTKQQQQQQQQQQNPAHFKEAVSNIIPSAPKCSSRHFVFHRKYVCFK